MKIVLINPKETNKYFNDVLSFIRRVDHLFEPPLSERVNLEDYTRKLHEESFINLIIDNEKIQAVCAYYCTPRKFDFAFLSYIASIQKGLGGLLMEEMISKCKEMGAKGIETQTWETNYKSLKLFKRYNFTEVSSVSNRNTSVNSSLLKLNFND